MTDPVPAEPAEKSPTGAPLPAPEGQPAPEGSPGFGARGRVRRRARFLRKARELAYRDLGGLVFNLHRFGHRNDALVLAKLDTLGRIDTELRALESALDERQAVTVLREAGVTACPRCAAIHSGEDRFCPNCGLSMSRHVDLLGDFQSAAGAAGAPTVPAGAADPPPANPLAPAPSPPAPAARPPASTRSPAPAEPPSGTHTTVPARAPAPALAPAPAPATDQPTEIIRPPASDA